MKRWCHDRFPPIVKTDTVTIIHDTTIIEYKDTVIHVPVPGETVFDTIYLPQEIQLPEYTVTRETELCRATATLKPKPPRIIIELEQKDTLLIIELEQAHKTITRLREQLDKVTETQIHEIRYIPTFYRFTFWFFIITLIFIVLMLIIRLR